MTLFVVVICQLYATVFAFELLGHIHNHLWFMLNKNELFILKNSLIGTDTVNKQSHVRIILCL